MDETPQDRLLTSDDPFDVGFCVNARNFPVQVIKFQKAVTAF